MAPVERGFLVMEYLSGGSLGVSRGNGRGVDTGRSRPLGLGMVGMHERALSLGGKLLFESSDGYGTTVRATFPRITVTAEELTK